MESFRGADGGLCRWSRHTKLSCKTFKKDFSNTAFLNLQAQLRDGIALTSSQFSLFIWSLIDTILIILSCPNQVNSL